MGGGRRRRRECAPFRKWRSLSAVLAEHQHHPRTRRALPRRLAGALAGDAGRAARVAVRLGLGCRACANHRLPGSAPGRVRNGLLRRDHDRSRPIGNAYLPSPAAPVGVRAVVGSTPAGHGAVLRADSRRVRQPLPGPWGVAARDRRAVDPRALDKVLAAELLLLAAVAVWPLRRRLIAPPLGQLTRRRVLGIWVLVSTVPVGSILAPPSSPTDRSRPSPFDGPIALGQRGQRAPGDLLDVAYRASGCSPPGSSRRRPTWRQPERACSRSSSVFPRRSPGRRWCSVAATCTAIR